MMIRPIRQEDLPDIHHSVTQPRAIWGTAHLPSITQARFASFFGQDPHVHAFVAEVDGKAVGNISLRCPTVSGRRHAAEVVMYVHDAYQGRGIGSALMAKCLDLADNWLMLERVELDVYPDNEPAVRLYHKFGFEPEGTFRKAILRDGAHMDLLAMARLRGRAQEPFLPDPPGPVGPRQARADVTIRPVRPEDAAAIHAIRMQPSVIRPTGALPSLTIAQVRTQLENLGPADHYMVAEADGRLVGIGHLEVHAHRRSHSAIVQVVAVDEAYAGRGTGSRLMESLINLGEKWLNVRRIYLEVYPDNHAAIRVYERYGFVTEVRKRAAYIRDGKLADVLVMARLAEGF